VGGERRLGVPLAGSMDAREVVLQDRRMMRTYGHQAARTIGYEPRCKALRISQSTVTAVTFFTLFT
jgi:hypothetical protein